jgi:hypothetical protein
MVAEFARGARVTFDLLTTQPVRHIAGDVTQAANGLDPFLRLSGIPPYFALSVQLSSPRESDQISVVPMIALLAGGNDSCGKTHCAIGL